MEVTGNTRTQQRERIYTFAESGTRNRIKIASSFKDFNNKASRFGGAELR